MARKMAGLAPSIVTEFFSVKLVAWQVMRISRADALLMQEIKTLIGQWVRVILGLLEKKPLTPCAVLH